MKEVTSYRLHPTLQKLIEKTAKGLNTSHTWVVEAALADYFRDELDPKFKPGMPHKEQ